MEPLQRSRVDVLGKEVERYGWLGLNVLEMKDDYQIVIFLGGKYTVVCILKMQE